MTADLQVPTSPSQIFKVGLSVPSQDQLSHCIGLGVGPSEDVFREWLHRRMLLSQMPFLWVQIDPVQLHTGGDLERLMHMLAYAGGCSPFRQVFWRGDEVSLPDSSHRFLHDVVTGEGTEPSGGCALLLAGKAVSDLRLAVPGPRSISGGDEPGAPRAAAEGQIHGTVKEAPLPWMAALLTLYGSMRRRLAYLWMAW